MVSVIIPVYNAEKFIRRCLDSVIHQTYKDLDIIVVDDGSTDGSGAICDEYAAKDNRFHVIHEKNAGVSVARQVGLDSVRGDYCSFIDADDWAEANMIELMLKEATTKDADIVICDYYIEKKIVKYRKCENIPYEINSETYLQEILLGRSFSVLWNKLFKTSVLKKNRFYPPKLLTYEDTMFLIKTLLDHPKISYIQEALYHYTENIFSITHNLTEKSLKERLVFFNEVDKILSDVQKIYFRGLKLNYLEVLFISKNFTLLKSTFPEIHHEAIKNGEKYNYKLPLKSCLSLALRGKPHLAYYLYSINMQMIHFKESIAFIFNKWFRSH